jgi:hypothetical protein
MKKKLTLAAVRKQLREVEISITKKGREYTVNFLGGRPTSAYITESLEDGLETGKAMAKKRERAARRKAEAEANAKALAEAGEQAAMEKRVVVPAPGLDLRDKEMLTSISNRMEAIEGFVQFYKESISKQLNPATEESEDVVFHRRAFNNIKISLRRKFIAVAITVIAPNGDKTVRRFKCNTWFDLAHFITHQTLRDGIEEVFRKERATGTAKAVEVAKAMSAPKKTPRNKHTRTNSAANKPKRVAKAPATKRWEYNEETAKAERRKIVERNKAARKLRAAGRKHKSGRPLQNKAAIQLLVDEGVPPLIAYSAAKSVGMVTPSFQKAMDAAMNKKG